MASMIDANGVPVQLNRPEKSLAAVKLREWRRAARLSQHEVAVMLGCVQKVISKYELGTSKPPIDRALELARISRGRVAIKDWAVTAPE